jgi:hypothetical protein
MRAKPKPIFSSSNGITIVPVLNSRVNRCEYLITYPLEIRSSELEESLKL